MTMPDLTSRRRRYHYTTALNVLAKSGIDLDRVRMLGAGEYYNYRGEIVSQEPLPGTTIIDTTEIRLVVGMLSPVDYMPYQMFYGIGSHVPRSDEWEDQARHLMAPFDASVIRYRTLAVAEALRVQAGLIDLSHLIRFLKLFDFKLWDEHPTVEEALFWSTAMPSFNRWAGNPLMVTRVLEQLFGWEFRVVENIRKQFAIPSPLHSRLGVKASRLGDESILGDRFFDHNSAYELQIRGVAPGEVSQLLPGKPLRRKLDWALRLCMPNNLDCRVKIIVQPCGFRLGEKASAVPLGYATFV
jgi:hypothetical protein